MPGQIHLVVLFGGQSAEHDVSCVTAAHVLAAVDTERYRVTPIGISTDGTWALADGASRALATGPGALPAKLDPTGTSIAPISGAGHRRRRRRADRGAATAARPDG